MQAQFVLLADCGQSIGVFGHGNDNLADVGSFLHESERLLDLVGGEVGHWFDRANGSHLVIPNALFEDARVLLANTKKNYMNLYSLFGDIRSLDTDLSKVNSKESPVCFEGVHVQPATANEIKLSNLYH